MKTSRIPFFILKKKKTIIIDRAWYFDKLTYSTNMLREKCF